MSARVDSGGRVEAPVGTTAVHHRSGFSAHRPRPRLELLQLALVGNACFCGLCGFVSLLFAPLFSIHIGLSPEPVALTLTILGSVLAGYSIVLFAIAMQRVVSLQLVKLALALDILWVVLSGALLLMVPGISQFGRLIVIVLAAIVLAFAFVQWLGLRRYLPPSIDQVESNSNMDTAILHDVTVSWMALELWVKVWLIFLNLIFLCAIAFVDKDVFAVWTLIMYVVTGPFLMVFMVQQRGLSRLLGLAHIVPWTPLLVYLVFRMTTSTALGAEILFSASPMLWSYVVVLIVATGISLAFDYWDVIRWFKGERYIIGAKIPD